MSETLQTHSRHVPALDGLRGYAAILVTFFHAILHIDETLVARVFSPPLDRIAMQDLPTKLALSVFNGASAVQLFYVLSGVVLCQSLLNEQLGLRQIGWFLARRSLRLFPALMLCIFLMWGLSAVYAALGWTGFPLEPAENAIRNALLIDTSVNHPSTSVQIEALATPFILLFALLVRRYAMPAAFVLLSLSIFAIDRPELVFNLPNMNLSLVPFYAGMAIALPEAKALFVRVSTARLLFVLAAAFFLKQGMPIESLAGLVAQVMLLAALVGMLRHASGPTTIHGFLENRFSQFMGRISYSYYLLNVPVLFILWFTQGLQALSSWSNPVFGGLVVGLLSLLATIPLAYLSQRYCEQPCINFGRKMTEKYSPRRTLS